MKEILVKYGCYLTTMHQVSWRVVTHVHWDKHMTVTGDTGSGALGDMLSCSRNFSINRELS